MRRAALPLALGLLTAAGCAPNLASQAARPPGLDRPGEAKCGVTKSQSEPLIVEWPAAARAKLEALSRAGVVAVRYSGCEMEVLASCSAPGKYAYTAITTKRDHVAIHNEDDLYASIPLGAAKLEGKLERSGELDVDMAIVGRYATDRAMVRADELTGPDCDKATHVVTALTVGAFDFFAGAGAEVGGGASVGNAGGGASSKSSKELLNSDGTMSVCDGARTSDGRPPEGCGAILRLEVVPLGQAKKELPVAAQQQQILAALSTSGGLMGTGGEVELAVPEKDEAYRVAVEAGGKTYRCAEPVTYYKACHLAGLPEGKAVVHVDGTSRFDRDIPVSADGRTNVQILHRGRAPEIVLGSLTALGVGGVAFGALYGGGPGGSNDLASIVSLVTGGTLAFTTLLTFIPFVASAHDGLLVESPGKPAELGTGPKLRWGGPAAPTTFQF